MNTREEYLARFARVVAYIDDTLAGADGDLTVERLGAVAAFSKFHFQRQWTALFELGVGEYVQLVRLKRATYQLAFRLERTVLQIALGAGYESPEAFARAFKRRLGQTPTEWRRQPAWFTWDAIARQLHHIRSITTMNNKKNNKNSDSSTNTPPATTAGTPAPAVELVAFEATRVAALEHRGDPRTLGDTIRRFIAWRKENHLPPRTSATFNVLYDDPETTPPEEFRLDLCAAVTGRVADNPQGVVERTIPGGRCAVLRHTGSDDGLGARLTYLYREWLPDSGHEPRDFPPYVRRVRFFPDVPEAEAVTDIFLPLK